MGVLFIMFIIVITNANEFNSNQKLEHPNDTFTPLGSKFSDLYFNQIADYIEHI